MTKPLQVLCVIGTSAAKSATHTIIAHIARRLDALGADIDIFDPSKEPLLLFNPESSYSAHDFLQLQQRVEKADAYVLATPDYHGSISSTLKNFLDHFWQEFTGKLFAQVVCPTRKASLLSISFEQSRANAMPRHCLTVYHLPARLSKRWQCYWCSSRGADRDVRPRSPSLWADTSSAAFGGFVSYLSGLPRPNAARSERRVAGGQCFPR